LQAESKKNISHGRDLKKGWWVLDSILLFVILGLLVERTFTELAQD
jgi:hypothetical protein